MIKRLATVCAFALCLAACAKGPAAQPLATHGHEPANSPAEQVAEVLVQASQAHRSEDKEQLRRALGRLSNYNVEPVDDEAKQQLATWAQVADYQSVPMRGRALGAAMRSGTISPGQSKSLNQTFLSGQKATIVARSTNGGNVHLIVRDGDGDDRCSTASARALCTWVPIYTSRYTISVSNPGRERIDYFLVID